MGVNIVNMVGMEGESKEGFSPVQYCY